MRYTIKEHTKFRLRKPYKRKSDRNKMSIDYYTAYERNGRESNLKVNVLIMAKERKNNNDSRGKAGDLFSRLGRKAEDSFEENYDEEFVDDASYEDDLILDSIDVSSEADEGDSDLDINELLRKYLPSEDLDVDEPENDAGRGTGVLSKLKNSAAMRVEDEDYKSDEGNDPLINALDSAFDYDSEYDGEGGEEYYDDEYADEEYVDEDDIFEKEKPKKKGFLAGLLSRFRKTEEVEEYPEEYEEYSEEYSEDYPGEYAEHDEYEGDADDGYVIADEADEERVGDSGLRLEDEAVDGTAYGAEDESVKAEEATREEYADSEEIAQPEENGEYFEEEISAEGDDSEEDIDPTDINLMVAFGLDNGDNKQSDRAKELGDLLEAKQLEKAHKFKLDRPEYVDKTQTPDIRKEFHDNEVSVLVRLGVCAVFALLLLIFENISVITGIFTGTQKQFAGAFDPAVYPVVYIMVSLQLLLLACLCGYKEMIKGVKHIFMGAPSPYSMTVILAVAGIIYSIVLANIIKVPTEPVMFNFVVAVAILLTLVAEMCNNKRESMNFRIIANKRPKHIVRRLPDEESECETRAFADADDICDVMKIEKTDFVEGFFARLRTPDYAGGIFMTFIMSVAVAIAILFGIFANIRGEGSSTIAQVIYSAMLIIIPLSVYATFSYPMYRANLAAQEYDSAIIGEAALEEYSNASIISFDDKNVFPSYSVKVQNMRIYNNARIDRVLYYAASVFARAGGPLQDVFEVATRDMGISENVEIFDTESGFLASQVDGVNIIFGSCKALRKRGLEISDEQAFDDVDFSDELEIMYMFREDKLVAKMYIQYVMDSDIDLILKQFSGSGLYVCVRTFDPNIDERMIARKLNMKRMPLKIVRYRNAEEVGAYTEKADSGLVTCGTPKSLLQIISYCGKVLHTKKTNLALSVLSVMIGVAILVLLLLTDSIDSVSSLFVVIYQIIWLIPMVISSRMFIR